ncbi:unnamed protein product, partial [Meganyctiphanes norvegica]
MILVGCTELGLLDLVFYATWTGFHHVGMCHLIQHNKKGVMSYDSRYLHFSKSCTIKCNFITQILLSKGSNKYLSIKWHFDGGRFLETVTKKMMPSLLTCLNIRDESDNIDEKLSITIHFGDKTVLWLIFIFTINVMHFLYHQNCPSGANYGLSKTLFAFSAWMEQRHGRLILLSGAAVLIFRSELCLLLGPMLLTDLATKRLEILKFLRYGIPSGILCLGLTIGIDSIFWRHLLWPEGDVFWFNTYQNQSHNWGVYPFLWYWYSALPRALGLSLLLVPIGIAVDKRVRVLLTPALVFVALYSFMPHKELRFIIYVFPLFNVAAARASQFFWEGRDKTGGRQFLAIGCILHLICNAALTGLLVTISSANYPGGVALQKFHEIVPASESVNLHIDNLCAQSGVSRFTQLNDNWIYNKTENLQAGSSKLRKFTHLLVEAKSKFSYNLKKYKDTHEILASVEAFSHLHFNYQQFPPVKVRVKPTVFILKNLVEDDIELFEDISTSKMEEDIVATIEEGEDSEKEEKLDVDLLSTNPLPEEPLPVNEREGVVNEATQENFAAEDISGEGDIVEEISDIVEAVTENIEENISETVGADEDRENDDVSQDVEDTPMVEKEIVVEDEMVYNGMYVEENDIDDSIYDKETILINEDENIIDHEENDDSDVIQEEDRPLVEVTFPEEIHSQVSEKIETFTPDTVKLVFEVPTCHFMLFGARILCNTVGVRFIEGVIQIPHYEEIIEGYLDIKEEIRDIDFEISQYKITELIATYGYIRQPPTCIRCGSLHHQLRHCTERKATESITVDIDIESESEHGSSEEESNADNESENEDESEYGSVYGRSGQSVPDHDPSDVQLDEHRQPSNNVINPEPDQMLQEVTTVEVVIAEDCEAKIRTCPSGKHPNGGDFNIDLLQHEKTQVDQLFLRLPKHLDINKPKEHLYV